MHMVLGPRPTPSDRLQLPPVASTARYDAFGSSAKSRIGHRFERCKLRRASQGPRRGTRVAEASEAPRGWRTTRL